MTSLQILDQKAAEINYFRFENLPSEYLEVQKIGDNYTYDPKYKLERETQKLPSEVLLNYTHGIYYECSIQRDSEGNIELYYIESSTLFFLTPENNIARLRNNKNKYVFMLDYSYYRKISQIDHYIQKPYLKDLKEPNLIGVFSDKKINDWFTYLDAKKVIQDQMIIDSLDKNTEIEKEIQKVIDSLNNCKVSKWHDNTTLNTPLFGIEFCHDRKGQFLSKKIKFKGSIQDIINVTNKIN